MLEIDFLISKDDFDNIRTKLLLEIPCLYKIIADHFYIRKSISNI